MKNLSLYGRLHQVPSAFPSFRLKRKFRYNKEPTLHARFKGLLPFKSVFPSNISPTHSH